MRRVMVSGLVAVVGVALWVVPAGATGKSSSNGEATKSPTTILADAKAATGATTAVRISGTVTSGGKPTSLNIVSAQGAGGGTITSGGATINIVVAPPNVYLEADKKSWTKLAKSAVAGQLFAGKWLQTTTADPNFGSFAQLLDAGTLTQQITATGTVTKGGVTTFHGKQAVPLKGKKGTLYVAATGSPHILGIVGSGAKDGGQLLFTQYGSAKVPSAPSNAISLSQLQQSSGGSQ
jgi:hypothetical protein